MKWRLLCLPLRLHTYLQLLPLFLVCICVTALFISPNELQVVVLVVFASYPVFKRLWMHPRLDVPFSFGINFFFFSQAALLIGLVPNGTFLIWKSVAESFGTNCNPLRVSAELLQLIVSHSSIIFELSSRVDGFSECFQGKKWCPSIGWQARLVQTLGSGHLYS